MLSSQNIKIVAVGSGASTAQRKGKLVATNPRTGKLPNNILSQAPDAASSAVTATPSSAPSPCSSRAAASPAEPA